AGATPRRPRPGAALPAPRTRRVGGAAGARRQIERALHDGAQQRLVNVGLGLRLAHDQLGQSPSEAGVLIEESMRELTKATAELRELARGIHPAVLSDGGLPPALPGPLSGP